MAPWIIDYKTPLCMGCPKQEYWSGLPFPSPGDLPNPGTEPVSLRLLAGGFFTTSPTWEVPIVSFNTFIQLFHACPGDHDPILPLSKLDFALWFPSPQHLVETCLASSQQLQPHIRKLQTPPGQSGPRLQVHHSESLSSPGP